jgi:hypothetical protein
LIISRQRRPYHGAADVPAAANYQNIHYSTGLIIKIYIEVIAKEF